ncbi:MAG TPA: translocation/assembly module TamB domain-containing protein [Candidatus Cloacimonadota bacterium]|nr:translocation/assembly module TamB domain-containing protein [Candidatus Cloacimonadota bacterium]
MAILLADRAKLLMKKTIRILLIIFISLFALILILLNLIYLSNTVQNAILHQALKIVNKKIPADISFSKLNGNLFKTFTIKDISIDYENNTIVNLKTITVQFDKKLFTNLKKKLLIVPNIHTDSLSCNIVIYPDSTINIVKAFAISTEKDTTKSDFSLILESFNLNHINITLNSMLDQNSFKKSINNLHITGSFNMKKGDLSTEITDMAFVYDSSPIALNSLKFSMNNNKSALEFDSLTIRHTHLSGSLDMEKDNYAFDVNAANIDSQDINYFFKKDILMPTTISLESHGVYTPERLTAQLSLNTKQGSLKAIIKSLDIKDKKADFAFYFNNFNPLQFTQSDKAKLTGTADITIDGLTMQSSSAVANIQLKDISYQEESINNLDIQAKLNNNKASIFLQANGYKEDNSITAQLSANNIFNAGNQVNPHIIYHSDIELIHINPYLFIPQKELNHYFDIKTTLRGQGIDLHNSNISMDLAIKQAPETAPQLFTTLSMILQKEREDISAKLEIENAQYDSIAITNLKLIGNLKTDFKKILHPTDMSLIAHDISIKDNDIKELSLKSHTNLTGFSTEIINQLAINISDSLDFATDFSFDLNNLKQAELHSLLANYKDIQINKLEPTTKIAFQDNTYKLENLKLQVDQGTVELDASFADNSLINAKLAVNNLPLSLVNTFLSKKTIESGFLNWQLNVSNTLEKPNIDSRITIENISLSADSLQKTSITLNKINLNMQQDNDSLCTDASIVLKNNKLNIKGTLPIYLNQQNALNNQIINKDKGFNLTIDMHQSNLQVLNPLIEPNATIEGNMDISLSFSNTLNKLKTNGRITLNKARLKYPEFGTDLQGINASININPQEIILDSLFFNAGKGSITTKGRASINLDRGFSLDSLNLNLNAQQAHLLNSPALNSKLNGHFVLTGNKEKLNLIADASFIDTKVNVDHLKRFNKYQELSTPLLLQSQQKEIDASSSTEAINLPNFKNLNVDAKLTIPRNTWITGKDMNFELTGNLQVKTNKGTMILDGDVELLRGYYALYGKRFNIKKAVITFIDDRDLNPIFDITASYRFREGDERRDLNLIVTGNLHKPQLSFTLDSIVISEADAISYIIFGKNLAQLSNRDQSSVNNELNAENIAASLLLNSLTSKINDSIKETLHLDMAEITGYNQYGNAEIQVGKYFGDKFFVSYTKEFNIFNTSSSQQEAMNIEYQISRNLFLQSEQSSNKNSGIDLIFKWESK